MSSGLRIGRRDGVHPLIFKSEFNWIGELENSRHHLKQQRAFYRVLKTEANLNFLDFIILRTFLLSTKMKWEHIPWALEGHCCGKKHRRGNTKKLKGWSKKSDDLIGVFVLFFGIVSLHSTLHSGKIWLIRKHPEEWVYWMY